MGLTGAAKSRSQRTTWRAGNAWNVTAGGLSLLRNNTQCVLAASARVRCPRGSPRNDVMYRFPHSTATGGQISKMHSTPPTAANMTVVAARHVAHTFRRGSRVTVEVSGSVRSAVNVSRAMNVARYVSTFVWLSGSKMQVASLSAGPQRVAMPSFWRRLMSW